MGRNKQNPKIRDDKKNGQRNDVWEPCPRNNVQLYAEIAPAPVCLPPGGDRTGLKIQSLLNAHMKCDHVGGGAWRSLSVPSKLLPNKLLPFCGHPTSRRQLWTSIQDITMFQNQKFHHNQRWVQLHPLITQYQQNARYWTLSREIQPGDIPTVIWLFFTVHHSIELIISFTSFNARFFIH